MLSKNPSQHPIIFITDIKVHILRALLQYIYLGEVQVEKSDLVEFMRAADSFKVKGLQHDEHKISETINFIDDDQSNIISMDAEELQASKRPKTEEYSIMDAPAPSTSKISHMDPLNYQVEFTVDTEPPEIALAEIMEKFKSFVFEAKGGVEIFNEYSVQGVLTQERKEDLIRLMCEFLQATFPNTYSQVKREMICEAVQCLFPGIFVETYQSMAELIRRRIGNATEEPNSVSFFFFITQNLSKPYAYRNR